MKIVRSKEQIRALIDAIEKEIAKLPECDFWGNSNGPDLVEMQYWVAELKMALEDIVANPANEAGYWLTSMNGTLGNDYGIE